MRDDPRSGTAHVSFQELSSSELACNHRARGLNEAAEQAVGIEEWCQALLQRRRAVFIGNGATARTASSEIFVCCSLEIQHEGAISESRADELRDSVIEHACANVSNLPLTQSQIGQYLGLTVVHINRILRSLRAQRVVYLEKHCVAILDVQQLTSLAQYGEIVRSSAAGPRRPSLTEIAHSAGKAAE